MQVIELSSNDNNKQTPLTLTISDTPPESETTIWYNTNDKSLYVNENKQWIKVSNNKEVYVTNTQPNSETAKIWINPENSSIYVKDKANNWIRLTLDSDIYIGGNEPNPNDFTIWLNTKDNKIYVSDKTTWSLFIPYVEFPDEVIISTVEPNTDSGKIWINPQNKIIYINIDNTWHKFISFDDIKKNEVVISNDAPVPSNNTKIWFKPDTKDLYVNINNQWIKLDYKKSLDDTKYLVSPNPPEDKSILWFNTNDNNLYVYANNNWIKAFSFNEHEVVITNEEITSTNKPDATKYKVWLDVLNNNIYVSVNNNWKKLDIKGSNSNSNNNSKPFIISNVKPTNTDVFWYNTNDENTYIYVENAWKKVVKIPENTSNTVNPSTTTNSTNDTYKVKVDEADIKPGYLIEKLDNTQFKQNQDSTVSIILNNKFKTLQSKKLIIENKNNYDIDYPVKVSLESLGIKDINQNFILEDENGYPVPYTFIIDDANRKYSKEKVNNVTHIYVRSEIPAASTKTIIVKDSPISGATDASYVFPFFIDFRTQDINELKLNNYIDTNGNIQKISNVTRLYGGAYIKSKQQLSTFNGSFEIESVGKVYNYTRGSICRIAKNDQYGIVQDGTSYIYDILYWSDGYLYAELPDYERLFIPYNIRKFDKFKLVRSRNNVINYYYNNQRISLSDSQVGFDTGYIYLYISSSYVDLKYILYKQKIDVEPTYKVVGDNSTSEKEIEYNAKIRLGLKNSYPALVLDVKEYGQIHLQPIKEFIVTPTIIKPEDNATSFDGIIESSPYITNNFSGEHTATDWQIATDEQFTNIVLDNQNDTSNLYKLEVSDLESGKKYYVRVRYRSNDIMSDWSLPHSFYVDKIPVIDSIEIDAETIYSGVEYTVEIIAHDEDNEPLSYFLYASDSNVSIRQDVNNPNKFKVKFPIYASDNTNVTLTTIVADSIGNKAIKSINVTVKKATDIIVDVLNNNTGLALYNFNNNINDIGGLYNLKVPNDVNKQVIEFYDNGLSKQAIKGNGKFELLPSNELVNKLKALANKNNSFSISLWFRRLNNNSKGMLLTLGEWYFEIGIRTNKLQIATADNWSWITLEDLDKDYDWHNLVINVYSNPTKFTVYLDKNLVKETGTSNTKFTADGMTFFGRIKCCRSGSRMTDIIVDNMRIFTRPLTDDEIETIYNNEL